MIIHTCLALTRLPPSPSLSLHLCLFPAILTGQAYTSRRKSASTHPPLPPLDTPLPPSQNVDTPQDGSSSLPAPSAPPASVPTDAAPPVPQTHTQVSTENDCSNLHAPSTDQTRRENRAFDRPISNTLICTDMHMCFIYTNTHIYKRPSTLLIYPRFVRHVIDLSLVLCVDPRSVLGCTWPSHVYTYN
jgi:hypothetical protein